MRMETALTSLNFSEYGFLGVVLLLIITGQLVPKLYYARLQDENKELRASLAKSMDLNHTQAVTLASYKQQMGGNHTDGK